MGLRAKLFEGMSSHLLVELQADHLAKGGVLEDLVKQHRVATADDPFYFVQKSCGVA